jgi:acyl dehydratase
MSARSCGAICAKWPLPEEKIMPAPQGYSTRTIGNFIGQDFGASAPITVDQARINAFADVTGDHQWIHVDLARTKTESPFGGPVAHGCLTLSLLAAEVGSTGIVPADAKGVINYGLEGIRFIAPVLAGKQVTASFKLTAVEDKGTKGQLLRIAAALNVEGSDKPALIGDVLVLIIG